MCPNDDYVGKNSLVSGKDHAVCKFLRAIAFTTNRLIVDINDASTFAFRVLLGNTGHIEAILDSNDVFITVHRNVCK